MFTRLTDLLPAEGVKIILVLFLSFLIGLEREEHGAAGEDREPYIFGGVRTFPLVGLLGYALARISGVEYAPLTIGLAVVGAFLWLSYKHKLEKYEGAGVTTEMSGLLTYAIGALVSRGDFWIATTTAIVTILLLELKDALESLSRRVPVPEILAFTKFLLLTAVILPILPNRVFGSFGFNPFQTWLIVVAASGISYGSYLLQKLLKGHDSVFLAAVLGGAYSSTVTTVVLAKRARLEQAPHLYAGAILMSSGVMYLRSLALVGIFSRVLMARLSIPFLVLGGGGVLGGWLWSLRSDHSASAAAKELEVQNPLELSAAFLFALSFVVLLAATHYAALYAGRAGVYGLATLTGLSDITPFILGLTQATRAAAPVTPLRLAAGGILVASASNNLVKGIYAVFFADRETGRQSLALLVLFALLGLLPVFF